MTLALRRSLASSSARLVRRIFQSEVISEDREVPQRINAENFLGMLHLASSLILLRHL
jgi:hypothetical protein